ncbi:hypothetical protein [Paracnuella aquatica]|uniref:hypothetical protein n=1 Tax=Paracnuella aquatica TaxID=2268757 RepID=UPI000DEFA5B5|nr:hypothetical protein [Paracnuella aquatica]RPD44393.1 hypothetical protein DRJ53_16885 [Paracnuella aquatica]
MEQQIQSIMQALVAVGFPGSLEWAAQVHLCFEPQRFSLSHNEVRGADQLRYQIWISRDDTSGQYTPLFYDAWLTRPIEVNTNEACADLIIALNQSMQVVNWEALLCKGEEATVADLSELTMVQEVIARLNDLKESESGAHYADLLKVRYWSRTPFEVYAAISVQHRSFYEVSQRFHFFDDGGGITLNEAYRFLLHRWREKQIQTCCRVDKGSVSFRKNGRTKK